MFVKKIVVYYYCFFFFLLKAVKLRPEDARAHTNLGAILHLLGQPAIAASSYREALRLQPGDRTTLANLGKLGATGEIA